MDKQLIEKIALEVANSLSAPYVSDESAVRFATGFLARIDAERGKEAVLFQYRTRPDWQDKWGPWSDCSIGSYEDYMKTQRNGDWHYETRKLFLSPTPTIPEGWAMVPLEITDAIAEASGAECSPTKSAYKVASELWANLIAAAQGERK